MTKQLFYDYPSTALIRFSVKNVFTNEKGLFRFKTKQLDFVVPEKLCTRKNNNIYIPNSIYQMELLNYYKSIYT